MGGGASTKETPPPQAQAPPEQVAEKKQVADLNGANDAVTRELARQGLLRCLDERFNAYAFKEWMDQEPYFKRPGIVSLANKIRKKLKGGKNDMVPLKQIADLLMEWDEISFYGLVEAVSPEFMGSHAIEFTDEDGRTPDERESEADDPEANDSEDADPDAQGDDAEGDDAESKEVDAEGAEGAEGEGADAKEAEGEDAEAKEAKGEDADDGADAEESEAKASEAKAPELPKSPQFLYARKEFSKLLMYVLLLRECKRMEDSKSGAKYRLGFKPATVLGRTVEESNLELFEEKGVFASVPEDETLVREQYSELVRLCREAFMENQARDDQLQIERSEHHTQIEDVKQNMIKGFRKQLKSIDERYRNDIKIKEALYNKMVNKYAKAKLKYKAVKNKFLHTHAKLGQYLSEHAKIEQRRAQGLPDPTPEEAAEQKAKAQADAKEAAEQVLNSKILQRRDSLAEGEDAKITLEDFESLREGATKAEIDAAKDIVRELLRARDVLEESDRKKHEEIEGVRGEIEAQREAYENKMQGLNRKVQEFSRNLILMKSALKQRGGSSVVKEISNTRFTSSLFSSTHSDLGDVINLMTGRQARLSRSYRVAMKFFKIGMRRTKSKLVATMARLKEVQESNEATDKMTSAALSEQQAKHEKLVEEIKTALESKMKERMSSMEKVIAELQGGNEQEVATKAIMEGKVKELEIDKEVLQKELAQIKEMASTMKETNEMSLTDAKQRAAKLNETIESLTSELDTLKIKLAQSDASAEVQEKLKKDLALERKRATALQRKVDVAQSEIDEATDRYIEERVKRIRYHNMLEDMKGKIRVYCRLRPMSGSEKKRSDKQATTPMDQYTIQVMKEKGRDRRKQFTFDEVYAPDASQEKVFSNTQHLIQSAYDGFNVCIFAYGQTGTGKTYTMFGEPSSPGIAPRAIKGLYDLVQTGRKTSRIKISCYMVELYKAKLQDLLQKSLPKPKLKVQKNIRGIVEVQGVKILPAESEERMMAILEEGNEQRKTSSTLMNVGSSRSHLILSILIEKQDKRTGKTTMGKLSLVDLAGSERIKKTGATAEQIKEANSINQSLSALGNVIAALSSGQKHVPYRSHVLTNLMSDSLGGNAKTLMFVNVGPSAYNTDETINALNYATRVKMVKNNAGKNESSKKMKEKDDEIARLRAALAKAQGK